MNYWRIHLIRTQLETERLHLRLFTPDDVQIMYELCTDPEIELPEAGFRYLKEYWGRGIGTEAALACVDFARSDLKISKLVAPTRVVTRVAVRSAWLETWQLVPTSFCSTEI